MRRPLIFFLCMAFFLVTYQIDALSLEIAQPVSARTPANTAWEKTSIEYLELKRRNWESHGTDVKIYRNGNFEVTADYLGETKNIRSGSLTDKQLDDLVEHIYKSNFFELQNEYNAPFKSEFSWWGYQLSVKTLQQTKSVRFHSENENVPDKLMNLVEFIQQATK